MTHKNPDKKDKNNIVSNFNLRNDKNEQTKDDSKLLDQIIIPSDLRKFDKKLLPQIAEEVRNEVIEAVSVTGGHLGAGLGVVELTTAIHYVFDTPKDKLIFDVGHQCYPHKILTARRDRIKTLRQGGGLSGFTKRSESEYDPFGAAHASTSISAGLGMAVARDFKKEKNNVIAVIGDGALSAGMAYEAMNNAGHLGSKLLVILNDNDMSIAPPVGAMSAYLARMTSSDFYHGMRNFSKDITKSLPKSVFEAISKMEEFGRGMVTGGTLFEELGFYYVGPIDGHNLNHLIPVLENIKNIDKGPILLHVVTKKGKGYKPAENASDKYHGVSSFEVSSGIQKKSDNTSPSFTKLFANSLLEEAKRDEKIIAITAAMPSGTGLDLFEKEFPERFFDVGIAEQHAVTFAGGLACEGMKPVCAIYSTFLQRAYDQVVHDIDLQNLPVKFAIDRAGLVGADGATHAGSFDIAYLTCLPNMILMAASDGKELMDMTRTALEYNDGPIAFRFPRGNALDIALPKRGEIIEIGKGKIIQEGSNDIAILNFGARLPQIQGASELLKQNNISITIADARFAKPLDTDLIIDLCKNHKYIITIEEGSMGGFGAHVLQYVHNSGLIDKYRNVIRTLHLDDIYMDQDNPEIMYDKSGLSKTKIFNFIMSLYDQDKKLFHISKK